MRPMSEIVNAGESESNIQLNSDDVEKSQKNEDSEETETHKVENEEHTNEAESNDSEELPNIDILEEKELNCSKNQDSINKENTINIVERQDSDGSVLQSLTEEVAQQSSVECRDRLSSVESKSHPSTWSFSQWSETYESLEDERPVEDLNGDPQKLILWAAGKNELETLRKLLEEDQNLVNARDNDLYTPLHRASYSNNIEVIKMLLSYDADISSQTADGWQALHCACKWDSVEAVSLLLQNGADINARTKGQITPLHLAASNANGRRTLELLLWHPYVDPNVKTGGGDTPYDIASRTGPLGALFEILEDSVNKY